VDTFYKELGKRISERRHAAGLTQDALAAAAEIGTSYLAHIEAGRKRPTLETIRKIAHALSVEIWQLMTDSRMTPDEKTWQAEARKLAEVVRNLSTEEVTLLLAMASKMGTGR
jgi:transcriptional regulator with XRE-family HTH domain